MANTVSSNGTVTANPVSSDPSMQNSTPTRTPRPRPSPTPSPTPTQTQPSPSPTPTGSGSDLTGTATLDSEEVAFLGLINNYRAQNGIAPLQVSVALTQASDWMSNDMASKNYFSHTDSPGHNANMLNANYKVIGIGRAQNPSSMYHWYWTTDFGGTIDIVTVSF